ncbi:hypothetical protein SG34_029955 [Thalassomonas viridans]|uniref:Uncharacterized protein n=1 Tax=Thalassomonas viridans TaxID=137584 RepID=A0AAE9ZA32_9GAMM|nr:hypothetical protein [Thalassomonas viridans]WDE09007.1 hypothetical protein SG34_029955 [Thalassomonas viridans]
MGNLNNHDDVTGTLAAFVIGRQNEGLSLERILSESGMAGISIYSRGETRARVLYRLGVGITPTELLEPALEDFVSLYPVFRWSELRYRFKSDPEQEIEAILHRLTYASRYIEQEQQYVWAPKNMWTIAVKKHLRHREPLGDQKYFDYLLNRSPSNLADNLRTK